MWLTLGMAVLEQTGLDPAVEGMWLTLGMAVLKQTSLGPAVEGVIYLGYGCAGAGQALPCGGYVTYLGYGCAGADQA